MWGGEATIKTDPGTELHREVGGHWVRNGARERASCRTGITGINMWVIKNSTNVSLIKYEDVNKEIQNGLIWNAPDFGGKNQMSRNTSKSYTRGGFIMQNDY